MQVDQTAPNQWLWCLHGNRTLGPLTRWCYFDIENSELNLTSSTLTCISGTCMLFVAWRGTNVWFTGSCLLFRLLSAQFFFIKQICTSTSSTLNSLVGGNPLGRTHYKSVFVCVCKALKLKTLAIIKPFVLVFVCRLSSKMSLFS